MNSKKLAALGIREQILPLKSLGFDLYECKNFREAKSVLNKLNSEGCELVIVTENIIEDEERKFLEVLKKLPLTVVVLPEYRVKRKIAKEVMKRIIREAVGFQRI